MGFSETSKARVAFLLISAALLLGFFTYTQNVRRYPELSASLFVMNGVEVEIKGYDCRQGDFEKAFGEIKNQFKALENRMSRFLPDSEISRINREGSKVSVKVDASTFQLLQESKRIFNGSRGAFDIACLPLLQLWKDSAKRGSLPTEGSIRAAKATGSAANIQLDPALFNVRIQPGMGLDLGGIAQGYFSDQGVEMLRKYGIPRGLVNCSGEIAVFDDRATPKSFSVAIYNPKTGKSDGKVELFSGAVSTSGNYARYFEVAGQKYSHIVDPVSGWPANRTASVTLQGPSAVEADAWSTACAVIASRGEDPYPILPEGFKILALVMDEVDSKKSSVNP